MAQHKYKPIPPLSERQIANILALVGEREESGCMPWIGHLNDRNYGVYKVSGSIFKATRLIFFIKTGKDPGPLMLCHSCDNPPCVNVEEHLFPGTGKENTIDALKKGRMPVGEQSYRCRLSEETAREILRLHREGMGYTLIARKLGITPRGTVANITSGRSWKHLPR